ncbi:toprim domain-containing protein [Rubellimicrobium rubrum]|uniref:toprim domain-containing protein n=1 Tax=Rubellimicrobium rubrum TaxID=2585369 RepID=UPI001FEC3364|nr:toprim domain-containing protein [Rubellimicrobium rubrum]
MAEGIETALSLASGLLPGPAMVWAALSASGLMALRLPPEPGVPIVATDGDRAGRAAGDTLAHIAPRLGRSVSLLPAPEGHDWNDVLQWRAA